LTETKEDVEQFTSSNTVERTWQFDEHYPVGYYRYTLFSASDIYLYIIKDASGIIYYEFMEYVVPDAYFWRLDYSETPSFIKSDATGFEFDISTLDNLPKPDVLFNPPPMPKNVSASAKSSRSITVSWDIVSGASSYEIYRSTSENGAYSFAGESTSTSYTDTELLKSTTYYYKIVSIDNNGPGMHSSPAHATTLPAIEKVIREEYTAAGNHAYTFNEGFPAIIEVYAIGGGGGGQGGHFSDLIGGGYGGTGGAGGGGAAAYMKLAAEESTSIGVVIGGGGNSGTGQSVNWTSTWQSGYKGENGKNTTVSVISADKSTTITANGGEGGGGSGQILSGGGGGTANDTPPVNVAEANFMSAPGANGSDGVQGHGNTQGDIQSRGGNSGSLAVGSLGSFGGSGGAIRNEGQRPPDGSKGGGGASDISTKSASRSGSKGGDGHVIIIITYEE
jgi:hypothetical protein